MKYEKSCGAIIIKEGKVLLLQEVEGHWSFPKGHVENNETEIETVAREVKEETNLDIIIDKSKRYITTYSPKSNVIKDVVFFLAKLKVNDEKIVIQTSEIKDYKWVFIDKVESMFKYQESIDLWKKIVKDLNI